MNRKDTTKLLTDILIADKLSDRKYFAKEVTLDYGTTNPSRVDVMQFDPAGVIYPSDIEKGVFTCYEIKSCKEDLYSGHGLNFFGEKNYIIMTMDTYKTIQDDYRNNVIRDYVKENYPKSLLNFGIMVPVPAHLDLRDSDALYKEFEHSTDFIGKSSDWKLWTAIPCRQGHRIRSNVELLFCMLRSKHSATNM